MKISITKDKGNAAWTVCWPDYFQLMQIVCRNRRAQELGKLIFNNIESNQVGLIVQDTHESLEQVMWIDTFRSYQKDFWSYFEHLTTYYRIYGCIFKCEKDAIKLEHELNKCVTWSVLSQKS